METMADKDSALQPIVSEFLFLIGLVASDLWACDFRLRTSFSCVQRRDLARALNESVSHRTCGPTARGLLFCAPEEGLVTRDFLYGVYLSQIFF